MVLQEHASLTAKTGLVTEKLNLKEVDHSFDQPLTLFWALLLIHLPPALFLAL